MLSYALTVLCTRWEIPLCSVDRRLVTLKRYTLHASLKDDISVSVGNRTFNMKAGVPPKGCHLRAKLHCVTSHKAITVIYCYSSLIVQCKFSHPISSKSQRCFSYYSLFVGI